MNRHRWIGLLLVVAMLAVAGWSTGSSITIWYHKQGILRADRKLQAISEAQLTGTPLDVQSQSIAYGRRIHHCDRLADLGYFFHKSYELRHLRASSFQTHQLAILTRGMKTFPMGPDRHWSVGAPADHFVIDVYDLPRYKSEWDAFATQINVPNVDVE